MLTPNRVAKSPYDSFPINLAVTTHNNDVMLVSKTGNVDSLLYDRRPGINYPFYDYFDQEDRWVRFKRYATGSAPLTGGTSVYYNRTISHDPGNTITPEKVQAEEDFFIKFGLYPVGASLRIGLNTLSGTTLYYDGGATETGLYNKLHLQYSMRDGNIGDITTFDQTQFVVDILDIDTAGTELSVEVVDVHGNTLTSPVTSIRSRGSGLPLYSDPIAVRFDYTSLTGTGTLTAVDTIKFTIDKLSFLSDLYFSYIGTNANLSAFESKYVTISGDTGSGTFNARVDQAYHGSTITVYNNDRSSSIFTCNTATVTQSLTTNGYNSQGTEFTRLKNLGII